MIETSRIGSSAEARAREVRSDPPPAAAWTIRVMSFSGYSPPASEPPEQAPSASAVAATAEAIANVRFFILNSNCCWALVVVVQSVAPGTSRLQAPPVGVQEAFLGALQVGTEYLQGR